MRPAAICYVYGYPLPNTSANSGAVMRLVDAVAAKGREVTIIHLRGDTGEEVIRDHYGLSGDIRLLAARAYKGVLFYPLFALQTFVRSPSSVIVTRSPKLFVALALLGRRVILELHQRIHTTSQWERWRRGLRLVRPGRIALAPLTPAIVERLDPLLAAKLAATSVIPSAAPDFARREQSPEFDVGYVGSFLPGKGIEIVEALASLCPEYRFVVFGDASRSPAQARRLMQMSNVTLGGFVEQGRIGEALSRFRVGLAPYASNGFSVAGDGAIPADSFSSLKIVEYMSAGRPVIASAVPAVTAVVQHERNGLLCDPDAVSQWRDALARLRSDPALAERLARAGRQTFEAQYSYVRRAERFLQLADQLR